MDRKIRAIIVGMVFAFLGLLFTSAESGGVWFVIGILAFYAEWRFGKKDENYEYTERIKTEPSAEREKRPIKK